MTTRAAAWAAAVILLGGLAACGQMNPAVSEGEGAAARTCVGCHGGTDNQTGAPPADTRRRTATTEPGVGAHSVHVVAGAMAGAIDCSECHPKPAEITTPGHMDGKVDLAWGTLASTGGTASWNATAATCTVYCHGSAARGGTNPSPTWTRVDGSQAACGACHGLPPPGHPALAAGSTAVTCAACHAETVKADGTIDVAGGKHVNGRLEGFAGHPAGWLTLGSPDHHAAAARPDPQACLACHAAAPPARVTTVTCQQCHTQAGGGDFTMSCNSCHGSAANPAPPRDTQGNTATTFPGVGAHQSHLTGAHGVARPLACASCHRVPAAVASPGHDDGTVDVTSYTGTDAALLAAVTDPGWSAATASCATSYCHSPFPGSPGRVPAPTWTVVDGTQAACGSCHGIPPAGHPSLAPGFTTATCNVCHPETVKPDGTIDAAGGAHVNGKIDGFAGHPPRWSHSQAAASAGIQGCLGCHSARPPATVVAMPCSYCHDMLAGGNDWTTSCTQCHGSSANAAPPKDVRGNTATTFVGVGAHQSHVTGAHRVTAPLGCEYCHPLPADVLAPTHLDGAVHVTPYTGPSTTLQAVMQDPGWDPTSASCATSYCHGATLRGGSARQPVWTRVDGTQGACGSCHGLPPTGHPSLPPGATTAACSVCHPETVRPDGSIDVAGGYHVNGRADGFPGHGAGWVDPRSTNFHGTAIATNGLASCWTCHTARPPPGASNVTCADCHDALAGGSDWLTTCFGCHGDRSTNAAPPKDVHGNVLTTAIGVGAHQSHVAAPRGLTTPMDCVFCHQKPETSISAGHLDGQTIVTAYTGTDPVMLSSMGDPGWNATAATCATTWCHGGYSGSFTYYRDDGSGTLVSVTVGYAGTPRTPTWTLVDGTQGACGTCHAVPPRNGAWHSGSHGGLTNYNGCNLCHPGTRADGTGFTDPSHHVNGAVDVTPTFSSQCFGCH